ncbi:MAG: hypothetical protein GX761_11270 [Gammaproteobacteria bacterium]|nr:hypothetical protein [Gammaproteobacteria bacterium]
MTKCAPLMIVSLLLLVGLLASGVAPRPSEFEFPRDVQLFLERREMCDHLRGEMPEPDDVVRLKEVERGVEKYCTSTDQELAALKAKYIISDSIMLHLGSIEARIEARGGAISQALNVYPANYSGAEGQALEQACSNWSLAAGQV